MIYLLLGLLLWIAAHMFKRLAPAERARLQDRMGNGAKGVIAVLLVLAVVLMVIGYKRTDFVPLWQPPAFMVHINNLLMVFAVLLYGVGHSKSRLRRTMRHPMLWGTAIWAVAHLLVNGDLASVVLFGTLLIWALAEMPLINRQAHDYVPFSGGSLAGDIRLAIITLVVFVVIVLIHGWIGPSPLPG